MLAWLVANIGTIVVALIVAVIVGLIVFSMVRDKKKGKHLCGGCGGDCAHCAAGCSHSVAGKNTSSK